MCLSLTVTRASADDLNDFGQRGAYADGDTVLTPLPVKALLGCAEGYEDVERATASAVLTL